MAGDLEHRVDGGTVHPTGAHLGPKLGGRVVCAERGTIRARLPHRLIGIGRAEDPAGAGDRRTGETPRVARPIEPLAVLHRDAPERRERFGLVEHPFGQVRVKPDALPVPGGEGAGLSQIAFDTPSRPNPRDEAGAEQRLHFVGRHPELLRRLETASSASACE